MYIETIKENSHYSNDLRFKELVADLKYVVDDLSYHHLKIKELIFNLAHQLDKEEIFYCYCNKKEMLEESRSLSNIENSHTVKSGEYDPY